jgi:hypothetical protein
MTSAQTKPHVYAVLSDEDARTAQLAEMKALLQESDSLRMQATLRVDATVELTATAEMTAEGPMQRPPAQGPGKGKGPMTRPVPAVTFEYSDVESMSECEASQEREASPALPEGALPVVKSYVLDLPVGAKRALFDADVDSIVLS